ncbi:MAG: hypothetical protein ACJAYR_002412 [Sneathiella sp.]|jgi:hypothetical protein
MQGVSDLSNYGLMKNFREKFKIPKKKSHRLLLGWALMFGGIFGFMPIAGFWMLPLAILVLSVDIPFARRLRRRVEVWWGRRKQNKTKLH